MNAPGAPARADPSRGSSAYFRIARHFAVRELRERFLGSVSGAAWALLQPVATLLVLLLVFGTILKVRLPNADPRAFAPFLVAGLWPWVAFSEALGRGLNAIPERAALISKVALPRSALVLAPILASFSLHGLGYLAVLAAIGLMGYPVAWTGVIAAVPLWLLLAGFAYGLALALATFNVFVRDTAQVVPQLLTLWFYLTPIFYPLAIMPPALAQWSALNPMTAFVDLFRGAWLGHAVDVPHALAVAAVAALLALALGTFLFRRASSHFEDFL